MVEALSQGLLRIHHIADVYSLYMPVLRCSPNGIVSWLRTCEWHTHHIINPRFPRHIVIVLSFSLTPSVFLRFSDMHIWDYTYYKFVKWVWSILRSLYITISHINVAIGLACCRLSLFFKFPFLFTRKGLGKRTSKKLGISCLKNSMYVSKRGKLGKRLQRRKSIGILESSTSDLYISHQKPEN